MRLREGRHAKSVGLKGQSGLTTSREEVQNIGNIFSASRAVREAPTGGATMAMYQVTYWQEIPSQVDAREGGKAAKQMLSQRFQELIDIIATRRKLGSSDDYISQWNKG